MNESKTKTGIRFGIITGIVYILVLVARYYLGTTPTQLGMASVAGYAIVVVCFYLAAKARKKELGGMADLKELFGTVFIVILITELCFSVFNYVYLRYLDPGYLDRFGSSTLEWMRQVKAPEKEMETFRQTLEEQKQTSFGTLALGFARAVVMDSLVGLVIAFALKKNKPVVS
jgi:hypothetical protein